MKILMIAPTPFFADRGCHVRILEEIKSLQKLGHQIKLTTYHNGRDIEKVDTKRIINIPWYQKLEAGASWHKFYLDFLLLVKTFSVGLKFKPDIIHAHLHEGAFIGKIISLFFRAPLIFDYQGSLTQESLDHGFFKENGAIHKFARWVENKINSWPDYIIQSSPPLARKKDALVLYDGIDTKNFRPKSFSEKLANNLGIKKEDKVVVYLGLLNEYQGVGHLIKAAKEVISVMPETKFLILGFPNVKNYQKTAKDKGLKDNFIFTGKVPFEKAADYLSLGTIAVAPKISQTEANQKVLCYMACQLPTVAFDTKINRQMISSLGKYAKFASIKSLSKETADLLKQSENDLEELGKKLRNRAKERFSWESVGKKIQKIYKLCLNKK